MADIIVTTPRCEMKLAAREAAECLAAGGGEYFRRFNHRPDVAPGDRIFYVEDGWVRGFAIALRAVEEAAWRRCDTSGGWWSPGWYVFMDARSWKWIRPIPMKGFQGYRYAVAYLDRLDVGGDSGVHPAGRPLPKVTVVGNWTDPRPSAPGSAS